MRRVALCSEGLRGLLRALAWPSWLDCDTAREPAVSAGAVLEAARSGLSLDVQSRFRCRGERRGQSPGTRAATRSRRAKRRYAPTVRQLIAAAMRFHAMP